MSYYPNFPQRNIILLGAHRVWWPYNHSSFYLGGIYCVLVAETVKNLSVMQESLVEPLAKGLAIHSSILAWRIPWTEEPGGLQSMRSERVGQDWAINTFIFFLSCARQQAKHDIEWSHWLSQFPLWQVKKLRLESFGILKVTKPVGGRPGTWTGLKTWKASSLTVSRGGEGLSFCWIPNGEGWIRV